MNEKQKRSMIIHFNDGSKKLLEFPTPVPDSDANLTARLKEALDARHLVLEADGALVVIPVGASSTSSLSRRLKAARLCHQDVTFKD